jgi:hypothetical protein
MPSKDSCPACHASVHHTLNGGSTCSPEPPLLRPAKIHAVANMIRAGSRQARFLRASEPGAHPVENRGAVRSPLTVDFDDRSRGPEASSPLRWDGSTLKWGPVLACVRSPFMQRDEALWSSRSSTGKRPTCGSPASSAPPADQLWLAFLWCADTLVHEGSSSAAAARACLRQRRPSLRSASRRYAFQITQDRPPPDRLQTRQRCTPRRPHSGDDSAESSAEGVADTTWWLRDPRCRDRGTWVSAGRRAGRPIGRP